MSSAEEVAGLLTQFNEIVKRVTNGSFDARHTKRALQDIIEGRTGAYTGEKSFWWSEPEFQLERAAALWPGIKLPDAPKKKPHSATEVRLLHVPDSFESLLEKIEGPSGYKLSVYPSVRLRILPQPEQAYTQPTWVGFDPEYGAGRVPLSLRSEAGRFATTEILSAVIQFPEWPLAWRHGASAPIITGHLLTQEFDDDTFLCFDLIRSLRELELGIFKASWSNPSCASPTVRRY